MADDTMFSVERDIKPLSGSFFPEVKGISGSSGPDRISSRDEIRGRMSDARADSAQMRIDMERSRIESERRQMADLEKLQKELDSVLNNPSWSDDQKDKVVTQIGINNAGFFQKNRAAASAYQIARQGISSSSDELTVSSYINRGGDLDQITDWAKTAGVDIDDEDLRLPPSVFASGIKKTGQIAAEARSGAAAKKTTTKAPEFKPLVDLTLGAELFKNKAGIVDENQFDSVKSQTAVEETVKLFGTPEELKQFGTLNAKGKLDMAQRFATQSLAGVRKPNTTAAATAAETTDTLWGVPSAEPSTE